MEEACLEVSVERLLLVVESVAARNTNEIRGERVPWNELRFFFLCHPVPGAEAQLPERPDEEETAVRWIPLAQLPTINVLPNVVTELLAAIDEVSRPTSVPNPHP
jgi:8-oxo-dGTP pyrophosphatase MutT (NUDIX family)